MQFNFKNKLNNRRSTSNNIVSFGKSSCRVAATPRTLGSLHFLSFITKGLSTTALPKLKTKLLKFILEALLIENHAGNLKIF